MSKDLYTNAVGCLMYVMICTRPDLTHEVSMASKFLSDLDNSIMMQSSRTSDTWGVLQTMASCLIDNRVILQLLDM
jgi:hypothetical protein